jgi:23S rRNA (cytidine1920-2'-O)/16S rRNA (cytidine1409-2'-O)-methyltransferase
MPVKKRLYEVLISKGLAANRSQVETLVKLGKVRVNRHLAESPNSTVGEQDTLEIIGDRYVSRAAYKLASVANTLRLNFRGKIVLDVGSSTGGFTDYALQHDARMVIAVDVGTQQMVSQLRNDPRVELHEKTDIRYFQTDQKIQIIIIDVSFISLREILPHVLSLASPETQVVAMAKPQFEAGAHIKHKGVIKNDKIRRNTLKELEIWIQKLFKIIDKADSEVRGEKGNQERFYLLAPLKSVLQKRS